MVECLQNVYHHLDAIEATETVSINDKRALLMIGKEESDYYVITGNYILNDRVEGVRNKLEREIGRASCRERV